MHSTSACSSSGDASDKYWGDYFETQIICFYILDMVLISTWFPSEQRVWIPIASERAILRGCRLRFNVQHWFRHEGGVGNIEPSPNPDDFVEGMVHTCNDGDLALLDAVESYGYRNVFPSRHGSCFRNHHYSFSSVYWILVSN